MTDKSELSAPLAATYEAGLQHHLAIVQERDALKKKLEELQAENDRLGAHVDQLNVSNQNAKDELRLVKQALTSAIERASSRETILRSVIDMVTPHLVTTAARKDTPANIADRLEADLRRGGGIEYIVKSE